MFISFTDKDKLLRCFFVISGLISGGGNFFKVGGGSSGRQKPVEDFFH